MESVWKVLFAAAWLAIAHGFPCRGQEQPSSPRYDELVLRLEAQQKEIRDLQERLDQRQAFASGAAAWCEPSCHVGEPPRRLPIVAEDAVEPSCSAGPRADHRVLHYYADYDNGFVIRPFDANKHPFELKVNGWIQFRHHGFARDVESWTDNAGVTRPVHNRNAWDIERGRVTLAGFALDQRLTYFLQLDGDTDGGETVDFFDYWWAWEISDRLQLQMGKRKVPASRQWLLGARLTRFVDRPMANDFFRPDRTTGLFAVGRIGQSGHYEVMVGNGLRTSNLPSAETDNRFAFAATHYWDPWGDYGAQIADYDYACDPLVRVGHSLVYSPQSANADGEPIGEADYLRLTDGTRLTARGALAPGVTVSQFDVYLYGVDVAWKWQGWSFNAEVFLRWIEAIRGDGFLPVDDLFQRGFYVEGGRFLVPQKLDVNLRYSQVSGLYGDASEYAAGFNWYPLDTSKMKISFDVTSLDRSPLQNTPSDVLVGDNGVLFRTQFQAEF